MSLANSLWGAARIHGELLKLGIEVCQATVAKYTAQQRKPPSQTWRTFLNNPRAAVGLDRFPGVPTVTFRLLYVFIVLAHETCSTGSPTVNTVSSGGYTSDAKHDENGTPGIDTAAMLALVVR